MKKAIWKFPFAASIDMPVGALILTAQVQRGQIMLWALVNTGDFGVESRKFVIFGTGHPVTEWNPKYIATIQLEGGDFIGHIFERMQ